MKKIFSISYWGLFGLLLLLAPLMLTSCDDFSAEAKAVAEYPVVFPKEGGFRFVHIRRHDGKEFKGDADWRYIKCLDEKQNPIKMNIEITDGGSHHIYNDWISFTVSPDRKDIFIKVEPNETGKKRVIEFAGSTVMDVLGLHIEQKYR